MRQEILNGLINEKGGEARISTAMRVMAEVIASDAAWLVAVNRADDLRRGSATIGERLFKQAIRCDY